MWESKIPASPLEKIPCNKDAIYLEMFIDSIKEKTKQIH